MSDSEWRLLQADKFAAERQRDIAVQSSRSWRQEAKRLEAQVERLTKERDEARQTLSDWTTDIGVRGFARRSELDAAKAEAETLTKERDDIHTLWLKCCSNSVALVHQHDELKAQNERLTYELDRWKEVDANKPDWEKLWEEQSEKVDALTAQVERLLAKEAARIAQELTTTARE